MTQILRNQPISVAEMDTYRRQLSSKNQHPEESDLYFAPNKRSRSRGIILSHQGWEKLRQAEVLCDKFGCRYTYEQLSERSLLDERTVSRLLSCETKVDKSTLRTFFGAFNLLLEAGDYIPPNHTVSTSVSNSVPTMQSVEVEELIEELSQLKQRMRECERQFHLLGLNPYPISQRLEA